MRLYIIFYIIFSVVIFTGCGENDIDISTSFNPDNIDLSEKENIDIDSVSSHYVFDFEYQPSVVELSDEQIEYLIVDDPFDDNSESLSFRADTPQNLLPAVGQIVVINSDRSDKFPFGFMGMIYDSSGTDFKTAEVELTDVYKNLNVDIRVNKEQLASTDGYAFIYDDSELEEVALDEFYDGFPNMRNQYDISEKLSGNEAALHPALQNQPFNAKPSGSNTVLELKKGELSLMGLQIFKLPKNYNWIKLTASGGITLKLLTQGVQVKIEDSNLTELRQDIGVRIGGAVGLKLEAEHKTPLILKGLSVCFPVPKLPWIRCAFRTDLGIRGSIGTSVDIDYGCDVWFKLSDGDVNDVTGNSEKKESPVFNMNWKTFNVHGDLTFTNHFAIFIPRCRATGRLESKLGINADIDIFNKDLYKINPKFTFDVSNTVFGYKMGKKAMRRLMYGKIGGFVAKDEDWTKSDISLKYQINKASIDLLPIFPELTNIITSRRKDSSRASLQFDCNEFFWASFFHHSLTVNPMPMEVETYFNIVDDRWFKDGGDNKNNVIQRLKYPRPVAVNKTDFRYLLNIDNLTPDANYFIIPEMVGFKGLVSWYGNPILLKEGELRLGLIGPIEGMDYKSKKISWRYDNTGRVSKVTDDLLGETTYYEYGNDYIKNIVKDWSYDENGNEIPYTSDITYLNNLKFYDKSGVLRSCRWVDEGESGSVKFYYDDQYHLTGIASDGIMSLEWDKDGRLLSIKSVDDGDVTTTKFSYGINAPKNILGQYSYATMVIPFLNQGKLIGRASSYLPTAISITYSDGSGNSTDNVNISYKMNGDGSIAVETFNIPGGGKLSLPYGYRSVPITEEVADNNGITGMSRASAQNPFIKFFKRHSLHKK